MSQNDFLIANQPFPDTRQDINDALQALASLSSGSSAPSTTYANMLWYDTGNNILKMRTEADDAWIDVGYLCQSTNKFCIFDDTNVVNSSGTQVGLIGDQPTSDWEAGTSTTESLVSPAKVKSAIETNAGSPVKAWVNFDGTGTVSIRESLNVSSITDNGTGDYTINFASALADANYAALATAKRPSFSRGLIVGFYDFTTTSVRMNLNNDGGASADSEFVSFVAIR